MWTLRNPPSATSCRQQRPVDLQDLVLVGVVNNPKWLIRHLKDPTDDGANSQSVGPDELEQTKQDLDILTKRQSDYEGLRALGTDVMLLSEAFGDLKADTDNSRLSSLSLQVMVYRLDAEQRLPPADGGSWKLIWQAAADTFHTTIQALTASELTVEKFDIYGSQECCSLACTELSTVDFDAEGLAAALASLRGLSVSFSDRIINLRNVDIGETGDSADDVDGKHRSSKTFAKAKISTQSYEKRRTSPGSLDCCDSAAAPKM
ncbi:hypothetical protein BDW74DRAFT_8545 [Aspergillus multicolor]|uniref:uncharacterized protein n=1 Tax=Aspergillus multicolor TaxID=41759 RepID=UPI003CCDAFD3